MSHRDLFLGSVMLVAFAFPLLWQGCDDVGAAGRIEEVDQGASAPCGDQPDCDPGGDHRRYTNGQVCTANTECDGEYGSCEYNHEVGRPVCSLSTRTGDASVTSASYCLCNPYGDRWCYNRLFKFWFLNGRCW